MKTLKSGGSTEQSHPCLAIRGLRIFQMPDGHVNMYMTIILPRGCCAPSARLFALTLFMRNDKRMTVAVFDTSGRDIQDASISSSYYGISNQVTDGQMDKWIDGLTNR